MLRNTLGAALVLGATLLSLPAAAQQTVTVQAGGSTRTLPLLPLSPADQRRISGGNASEVSAGLVTVYARGGPPARASVRSQMTEVKDQAARLTCTAFATVALYEKVLKGDLSEQCLSLFGDEVDDSLIPVLSAYAEAQGFYKESECKYSAKRDEVPPGLGAPSVKVTARAIPLPENHFRSLDDIRKHVAAGRAVAVSLFLTNDDWYTNSSTPVDVPVTVSSRCRLGMCPGHGLVVVGYDDATQTLEVKNSWGKRWRDGGYGRMTYKYFLESFVEGPLGRSLAL